MALRTACCHGCNGWCIVEAGAIVVDRTLARWWVLLGALPHATYIGFTGTPIDKTAHGKGTFKVFGTDDPAGYLDKYSIRESVADGTTDRLPSLLQVVGGLLQHCLRPGRLRWRWGRRNEGG